MKFIITLILCLLMHCTIHSVEYTDKNTIQNIVEKEPELIGFCIGARYYINENKIFFTKYGVVSDKLNRIPYLYFDQIGCFIACEKQDIPIEIQEYYEKTGKYFFHTFKIQPGEGLPVPNPFLIIKNYLIN